MGVKPPSRSLKKSQWAKSEGSDSILGIKRGKSVKNIQKIQIFWANSSFFASDSLESWTNQSHCSFLRSKLLTVALQFELFWAKEQIPNPANKPAFPCLIYSAYSFPCAFSFFRLTVMFPQLHQPLCSFFSQLSSIFTASSSSFSMGSYFHCIFFTGLVIRFFALHSHSRCFLKKCDRERIALVTYYKRVTRVNCSLTKSDVSDSLIFFIVNRTFALKKRAIRLKNFVVFTMFLTLFHCFPIFMPKSESLFKNEFEWLFWTLAHKKRAIRTKKTKSEFPTLLCSFFYPESWRYFPRSISCTGSYLFIGIHVLNIYCK